MAPLVYSRSRLEVAPHVYTDARVLMRDIEVLSGSVWGSTNLEYPALHDVFQQHR